MHEGGWTVGWWGSGQPVFYDPRGGTHFEGRWWQPELPADPVAGMIECNAFAGAKPDGWTASAAWEREADIPDDVYFRACESV